jgi:high-affinity iron transporter
VKAWSLFSSCWRRFSRTDLAAAGAVLGLATAVVLGFLLYWGGILNLGAFFKWTSLFILLVAAGLAAGAIRAFHEAGLWNHFQDVAFDLSNALHALSDRHPARRYLRLSGNAERQRSGDVLYLSGSGAGAVRMPPRTGTQASRVAP